MTNVLLALSIAFGATGSIFNQYEEHQKHKWYTNLLMILCSTCIWSIFIFSALFVFFIIYIIFQELSILPLSVGMLLALTIMYITDREQNLFYHLLDFLGYSVVAGIIFSLLIYYSL